MWTTVWGEGGVVCVCVCVCLCVCVCVLEGRCFGVMYVWARVWGGVWVFTVCESLSTHVIGLERECLSRSHFLCVCVCVCVCGQFKLLNFQETVKPFDMCLAQ